jgi:hypothetical protein
MHAQTLVADRAAFASTTVRWRHAALLLATLLIAGCAAGPQVRTGAAPGVDLGSFQTFGFFAELGTDRAGYHSLLTQQLMASTRRELEVRGYRFVEDPAEADLLVNFHAHVAEQLRVRSVPDPWINQTYWHHRRGVYRPWPGHPRWPTHTIEVDQYSEGRLSVDLVDARQNLLVWEGVSSRRLTQRTMADLGPAVDDAVHRMFQQFPVPPRL